MNHAEMKCKKTCPLCYGRGTVRLMIGAPKDNKFEVVPCPRMLAREQMRAKRRANANLCQNLA